MRTHDIHPQPHQPTKNRTTRPLPQLRRSDTRAPTCQRQKWHEKKLQTTQYDGIRKLLGVFKTTPLEPLHNLTGIPPIPYLLHKLLNAYTHRLWAMPPNALVHTVLKTNRCRVWPEYLNPHTNLYLASIPISATTYHPIGPCTAGTWTHPHLTYNPDPSVMTTQHHKEALIHLAPSETYIFCFHLIHAGVHVGCHRRARSCLGGELGPTSCGRKCTREGGVVGCHLGRWINCLHLGRLR